jgi:7,8-dihydroneopterin aldolase/epimerase/oxygenase
MALIELEEMEFHAYHGCFKEERIVGNKFVVKFSFQLNTSHAEQSDNLNDTVNYQAVYNLVREEMLKPSHLIENVARRILESTFKHFPSIEKAEVKVSKINPALGGKLQSVSVTLFT